MGNVSQARTGPEGDFREYSVFADPVGYLPYGERHHHFYRDRDAQWYTPIAKSFAECAAVIDIGCGPGLLLAALRDVGVGRLVGLERDRYFLRQCNESGLPVVEHDLNLPFPFLASGSFDGAVAHQSLDYLAPVAVRVVLRECARVLVAGGQLEIAASREGQRSGDPLRTWPISEEFLRRALSEAGFADARIRAGDRTIHATARRRSENGWQRRAIVLRDGTPLRPWRRRRPALASAAERWDNRSERDFTPVTSPEKDEVVIGGRRLAYYTGFRSTDGHVERAVCRAISRDGATWVREPAVPVLRAGTETEWDAGGVAAGSTHYESSEGDPGFAMYYSARSPDGTWPGIGLAQSRDGLEWEKRPEPILEASAYPGVLHLALADVIRMSTGRWLMHCEGMVADVGWAVFQADSLDGLEWQPTSEGPVLDGTHVPWAGRHVANPKCVELRDGGLLLGFNGADASLRFQLGLAQSDDGHSWKLLDVNPVLCTVETDYRIESLFLTRDALEQHTQRAFYFAADTPRTDSSSRIMVADADEAADWLPREWQTSRPGLYRATGEGLVCEPSRHDDHSELCRSWTIAEERQCTVMIPPSEAIEGGMTLEVRGSDAAWKLVIGSDGRIMAEDNPAVEASPDSAATAVCLRVSRSGDLGLWAWRDAELLVTIRHRLEFEPVELRTVVKSPSGPVDLRVDHADAWSPEPGLSEGYGDAHMYMGRIGSDDPILPDVDGKRLLETIKGHGISHALVMPYGSNWLRDTFGQIVALARENPDSVFPLVRRRFDPEGSSADHALAINQLELLWQQRLMYGVKVQMNAGEIPGPAVLDWLERRQLLTMWHVHRHEHLDWLEGHVLSRYTFPVILSHFGGYPLDRSRYSAALALLSRFPQLFLATSVVPFEPYLLKAITEHPDRILLGSDFPAVNPGAARASVAHLDAPDRAKDQAMGENLRFLLGRARWHREKALADREMLFPLIPRTVDEMRSQGFDVVSPDRLPPDEPTRAREFWGDYGLRAWYSKRKPWERLLLSLLDDLQPRSVLEFGCNVGQSLATMAAAAPEINYIGIDVNAEAVEAGRQTSGLDLRHGDEHSLFTLGEREFDLVFTVSVLDHIADISTACSGLLRCAARNVFCLEVTLPAEGKVVRHFDHSEHRVRESTGASYSWDVGARLETDPRVWRLERKPVYLHAAGLGPYYWSYLAFVE